MDPAIPYLVLALVLWAAALAARPLVELNILLYRKIRLISLADFWKRQVGWWTPTVRIVCAMGGVASLLVGLGAT